MNARQMKRLKSLLATVRTEKRTIAESRDVLRETMYEIEEIIDSADRGLAALNEALEVLSEHL